MQNVIPLRPHQGAEFSPGDCVRLADGREGIVRRRQYRHDRAEVQEYEITLPHGRGQVWAKAARVQRWFAAEHRA